MVTNKQPNKQPGEPRASQTVKQEDISQILVSTAVKRLSLHLNLLVSTFSPHGPLSSTDDTRHENKQRNYRK